MTQGLRGVVGRRNKGREGAFLSRGRAESVVDWAQEGWDQRKTSLPYPNCFTGLAIIRWSCSGFHHLQYIAGGDPSRFKGQSGTLLGIRGKISPYPEETPSHLLI